MKNHADTATAPQEKRRISQTRAPKKRVRELEEALRSNLARRKKAVVTTDTDS